MARTKRESERRRNKRLVGAAETQWGACRMTQTSAEKLRVDSAQQSEHFASTPDPPLQRKRNRAICPDYLIVRWESVKVSESRTLAREGRSEREHGEERVDFTVQKGRFQGREEGHAKKTSLAVVENSISRRVVAKALQEDLERVDFTPSLPKPEIKKKLGEKKSAHKMTGRNESG